MDVVKVDARAAEDYLQRYRDAGWTVCVMGTYPPRPDNSRPWDRYLPRWIVRRLLARRFNKMRRRIAADLRAHPDLYGIPEDAGEITAH